MSRRKAFSQTVRDELVERARKLREEDQSSIPEVIVDRVLATMPLEYRLLYRQRLIDAFAVIDG